MTSLDQRVIPPISLITELGNYTSGQLLLFYLQRVTR